MSYPNYSPDIAEMACRFTIAGGTNGAPLIAQMLCVVEEAGEAAAAFRRWQGHARRSGTKAEWEDELADVVLSAYVVADLAGVDLDGAVRRKFATVMGRSFKDAS